MLAEQHLQALSSLLGLLAQRAERDVELRAAGRFVRGYLHAPRVLPARVLAAAVLSLAVRSDAARALSSRSIGEPGVSGEPGSRIEPRPLSGRLFRTSRAGSARPVRARGWRNAPTPGFSAMIPGCNEVVAATCGPAQCEEIANEPGGVAAEPDDQFRRRWVMWLMICLSVVSVAIMLERGWFYWSLRDDIGSLAQKLRDSLRQGDTEGARQTLERSPSAEAAVVVAGLLEADRGSEGRRRGDAGRDGAAANEARTPARLPRHARQQRAVHRPVRHRDRRRSSLRAARQDEHHRRHAGGSRQRRKR